MSASAKLSVCSLCGKPIYQRVQDHGNFNGRVGLLEIAIQSYDIRSEPGQSDICFTCVANAIAELHAVYLINCKRFIDAELIGGV